ncbi:DNA mismatch repair protein MutS [Patescibacteria group bacterium]
MLKQYFEIKSKNKENILFFRLGDFYEMFGADAKEASSILDITLTARYKGTENETPMCGIPYHAAGQYIAKLTKAGRKVAVCEQVSAPNNDGIVKREVTEIITPGTTLDSSLLDKNENNFLVSIVNEKQNNQLNFGISFVDLTTGEFKVFEILGEEETLAELKRINPAEVIVDNISIGSRRNEYKPIQNERSQNDWYWVFKNVSKFVSSSYFEPEKVLCEQFRVNGLEGFGIKEMKLGIKASANLLSYLKDTQKRQLAHINKISVYNRNDYMILDESTVRNLDLIYNYQTKSSDQSLLGILDKTCTAMGARMLRQWIIHPLINLDVIKKRLLSVECAFDCDDLRQELRIMLKQILDIERLLAKIGCNRANARDLISLKESLKIIQNIKSLSAHYRCEMKSEKCRLEYILDYNEFSRIIDELLPLIDFIEKFIINDPPVSIVDGGIIKEGNDSALDELRKISSGGKTWIAELQIKERARTGINSLKIKFNKIFGYYIEISNANINSVPEDYMRKQTLVNGERFITTELKEYEEKVLTAEEKIKDIEFKIFNKGILKVIEYAEKIQKIAGIIGQLDVVMNLAQVARENNYTKPNIFEKNEINIKAGRHPVLEKLCDSDFISNDLNFDNDSNQLILLTGPNMAGKSVYLRQNALIVLMAQIGSYVPAELANLCIVDRIFTRVGASDNIISGQSTFMVEMQEASNILNNATEKSLIIFDELGRGTSTYDGVSIAWAVIEYIHNNIKAKTLFATHYHELVELADKFDKIKNYRMAVLENEEAVIFLHKIIKGGIDKSYGIEVAKLSGMPKELIQRAEQILKDLESGEASLKIQSNVQPSLLQKESKIEKEILNADLNNMTPFEVVNFVRKLKETSHHPLTPSSERRGTPLI